MRKIVYLLILFLSFSTMLIFSQENNKDQYLKLLNNNELDALSTLLEKWEKSSPNDTEMYIAYFNYYLRLGSSSQMTLGKMDNGKYGLYNKDDYVEENTKKAIQYLDKALIVSPDRLDVHFGKCSILSKTNNFEELTEAIKDYFNRSNVNNNKWLWSDNITFESQGWSGEDALFSGLNDYLNVMFNNFDSAKIYINEIVDLELKLYPNNVWGINLAARYFNLVGNKEKSIDLLIHAYEIDPSDDVILGNLAYTYEEIKDFENAIKYYNILKEINNTDAISFAKEGLERINNK